MIRQSFFAILISIVLIQQIGCQPVRDESQIPSTNETDSNVNDTSPSFTYGYPGANPRFEIDTSNPFRAMQQMLASMEQRFNGMFGRGMSVPGGMQSSSSSVFSSNGGQGGLDNSDGGFFGSSFFSQPCQQTIDETELSIKCNVTGYEPDQIKVDVNGQQLTISGKQVVVGESGQQNSTTQFQQIISLPDLNLQKMTSETKDDILTISVPRIPRQEEEKTPKKDQMEIA